MENTPRHNSEHPGHRAWEPEDPMQLDAVPASGSPDVMLACLVEEFARMGMPEADIEKLFESPFFQATHGLQKLFGPQELRRRIREVIQHSGVMKFRVLKAIHPSRQPDDVCTPPASDSEGEN